MDLGILNTVIAVVIVLLVLSLLVQSVQTLLKKLLKLKSRQIADSLKDLYEQAIGGVVTPASQTPAAPPAAGTTVPAGTTVTTTTTGLTPAEQFKDRVLAQFKNIGRKTAFGNAVLDSLSKQDLMKVIGKLELEQFFPDYVAKFQALCDQVLSVRDTVEALAANTALRGAASGKLAELRAIFAPIFTNVQAILEGKQVRSGVLFADLLRLGKLDIKAALGVLDDAQTAVTHEREAATAANNPTEADQLGKISDELAKVAKLIGDVSQKFDDAVSPLRQKLEQVEVWFDTVTQSFDERYARQMRTIAICISIVVVIVLNANFFRIYKNVSSNDVQRNLIVDSGPEILKQARAARGAETEPAPTQTPTATPTSTLTPAPGTENQSESDQTNASQPGSNPSPSPTPIPIDIKKEIERTRAEIDALSNTYQGFGFTPLSGQQVSSFLWSTGFWTGFWSGKDKDGKDVRGWRGFTIARNNEGVPVNKNNEPVPPDCQEVDKDGEKLKDSKGRDMICTPVWRVQTGGEWWESRKDDVVTLIGWAITVMLLSVGAPFWQDTLESLFGIKNLLRQRSGTQNIESRSGAGQPKE